MQPPQKNAIVTGAASGLGRAIALRLAADGWNIVVADRDEPEGQATVALIHQAGGTGHFERLDVSRREDWLAMRDRLISDWDTLDLLINNAGVCGAAPVEVTSVDDWRWILDVNLYGTIHGCHTMVEWLKRNPNGAHVINTASIAGLLCAGTMGAYNVSKAGVVALSETLYAELRPYGIGVTVLCPGFFESNLFGTARWGDQQSKELAKILMSRSVLSSADVANLAVRAIGTSRLYIVHGWRPRLLWRIKRLFPSLWARITVAIHRRKFIKK